VTRILVSVILVLGLSHSAHAELYDGDSGIPASRGVDDFKNEVSTLIADINEAGYHADSAMLSSRLLTVKKTFNEWKSMWSTTDRGQVLNSLRALYGTLSRASTKVPLSRRRAKLTNVYDDSITAVTQLGHALIKSQFDDGNFSAADRLDRVDQILDQSTDDLIASVVTNVKAEIELQRQNNRGTRQPLSDAISEFINQPKLVAQNYSQLLVDLRIDYEYRFLDDLGNYSISRISQKQLAEFGSALRQRVVCAVGSGCTVAMGYLIFTGAPLAHSVVAGVIGGVVGFFLKKVNQTDSFERPNLGRVRIAENELTKSVYLRKNAILLFHRMVADCKALLATTAVQ